MVNKELELLRLLNEIVSEYDVEDDSDSESDNYEYEYEMEYN
jgi:hypothetical protein